MKTEPISTHERTLIIRQLASTGKWIANRGGAKVEIARIKTPTGNQIHYSVTMDHVVVTDRAITVKDAVDAANQIIRGRAPIPASGRSKHRHGEDTDSLWKEA